MENTLEGGGADGENNILTLSAMCQDTARTITNVAVVADTAVSVQC